MMISLFSILTAFIFHPTFNSCSVEMSEPVEGAVLEYRVKGKKWIQAPDLRGNLMGLEEDTVYEVRAMQGKKVVESASFRTWKSDVPVGKTIELDPATMQVPYRISEKGTQDAWVRYVVKGGKLPNNGVAVPTFIVDSAAYVLIDNMTLTGGDDSRNLIVVKNSRGVRVRNCDLSRWGRRGMPDFTERITKEDRYWPGNGRAIDRNYKVINMDGAIEIGRGSSEVVVERCYFHDPIPHCVSWFYCHPAGAEAIVMRCPDHSTVIRYNDMVGSDGHRFNDCIEGERNFFTDGGFNREADIYGNFMIFANDDCMEIDGGQKNVRVFGNRFESALCGVSVQGCMVGPSILSDNLFSGMGCEMGKRGQTIKTDRRDGDNARCYVLNNIMWGAGKGIAMREKLSCVVNNNTFCGNQSLSNLEDCPSSSALGNKFKVELPEEKLDPTFPRRDLPFVMERARIDVGRSREPLYVKIKGELPAGTKVVRPAFTDWFDAVLEGNAVKVSFNEDKMQKRRRYTGAFIVRTPEGLSRPVSLYADTDFIPPYDCSREGKTAVYDNNFVLKGKSAATATFNVEKPGRYWIMVYGRCEGAESPKSLTLYVSIDGGKRQQSKQLTVYGYDHWQLLHPVPKDKESMMSYVRHFDLEAGTHTVEVRSETGSTRLHGMVLTDSPADFEPNQEYDKWYRE